MTPKHETRSALEPIEGAGVVTVCAGHQETVKDIYDALDRRVSDKMSKGQVKWTLGVMATAAIAFGSALWAISSNSIAKNDENIVAMDRRVLTLELQWQQVREQLNRIESEAKTTRSETNAQLEGLRRTLQEKKP